MKLLHRIIKFGVTISTILEINLSFMKNLGVLFKKTKNKMLETISSTVSDKRH